MTQIPEPSTESITASFCICTYNQEAYVREAMQAALAQNYEPLEIIVSDDCSNDQTFNIIEECAENYSGPHKLIINRNATNLGLISHVNKVLGMASGELIVGSAGDDISFPNRTEALVQAYLDHGRGPALLHGDVIEIDAHGATQRTRRAEWGRDEINLKESAIANALYIGASSAFSKPLIDSFPQITYNEAYEDLVWGFRAALLDAVVYVPQPLVQYRTEIGLSWTLHHTLSEKPEDVLQTEQRKRKMMLAVLKQRLQDAKTLDATPAEIIRSLQRQIRRQSIQFELINSPLKASRWLVRSPLRYYQGVRSLRKRRHRLRIQYEASATSDDSQ